MERSDYPLVIWTGKQPLHPHHASRYRLVYRGPARAERPDDAPFSVEKQGGVDMMKQQTWWPPKGEEKLQDAVYALSHALGLVLMVDPKRLNLEHPLWCEINLAACEGRPSRGCDCPKEVSVGTK